jgi:hypothetical protein
MAKTSRAEVKVADRTSKTTEFATNIATILNSQVMVANINGLSTDPETAFEIGVAFACNIPLLLLHTDDRTIFNGGLNAMVTTSSRHPLIKDLSKLEASFPIALASRPNFVEVLKTLQAGPSGMKRRDMIAAFLAPKGSSSAELEMANQILHSDGINTKAKPY